MAIIPLEQLQEQIKQGPQQQSNIIPLDVLQRRIKGEPPLDEPVKGIFGDVPRREFEAGERNIAGNIIERPAAATRAFVRGLAPGGETPLEGFGRAALRPQTEETFAEQFKRESQPPVIERAAKRKGFLSPERPFGQFLAGAESFDEIMKAEIKGAVADFATNPAELAVALAGKAPGVKQLVGAISKTKPARAFGRFLTKKRTPIKDINQAFKNIKNPKELAQKVRGSLFQGKKEAGEAFEAGIKTLSGKNPAQRVDLVDEFTFVKNAMEDATNNPGLKTDVGSILRKIKDPDTSKFVRSLVDNPELARNMTLQQAQDFKVAIQKAPSIATKLKQGKFANWTGGEIELLDLLDDVRLKQSLAFPEIENVRRPYAEFINNYKQVKNSFKKGTLLKKMREGFGDEEIIGMVKAVLPESTLGDIEGFKRATKAISVAKKVAGVGAGITGAGFLGRKIFGGGQ